MASDVRIWTGTAWESIKGPPGPTVVSSDANNLCKLGSDGNLLVAQADLDARYVNVTGDSMTGVLTVRPSSAPASPDGSVQIIGDGTNSILTAQYNGDSSAFTNSIQFKRTRGTTAAQTVVQASDSLGGMTFNSIKTDGTRARAGYVTAFATQAPLPADSTIRSELRLGVGDGANLVQVLTLNSAGVNIVGNITSNGTAHSFAANSIQASAIAGLTTVTDTQYVKKAGDWMSGALSLGGSSSFTATSPLDIDAPTFRVRQQQTPASQDAVGEPGTICWDSAYFYACVAQNQWRRVAWRDWAGTVTGGAWSPLSVAAAPAFVVSAGNGMFVADNSKWSVDGVNWFSGTGRPSGSGSTIAAYGNGTFVCTVRSTGTSSTTVYTSADGKAWTTRTYNSGGTIWRISSRAIAFGNSRFVILPNTTGTSTGNVSPRYSVDGINWITCAAPTGLVASTLSEIAAVVHSGSLFVAVGSHNSGATVRYLTSPDGVTWTARSLPLAAIWNDIAYGGGRFVAVSQGLAALHSIDGINWTQANLPASADWNAVQYGDGRFIATAPGTTTAAQSTDGITWTVLPMPSAAAWNELAWNGSVWVATNGTTTPAIFTPTPQLVTYFPITTSRKLVEGDANATVANVSTGAAPVTITIPADAALPFPIGTSITVMDASQTAVTTIKADPGVTLNWSGKLVGTNATVLGGVGVEVQIPGPLSQVVLRKVAADQWTIIY